MTKLDSDIWKRLLGEDGFEEYVDKQISKVVSNKIQSTVAISNLDKKINDIHEELRRDDIPMNQLSDAVDEMESIMVMKAYKKLGEVR